MGGRWREPTHVPEADDEVVGAGRVGDAPGVGDPDGSALGVPPATLHAASATAMSDIPTRRSGEGIVDTMKRMDGLSAVRRARTRVGSVRVLRAC